MKRGLKAAALGCGGLVFVLFMVVAAGLGSPWLVQVPFHLGAGWIRHSADSLPEATINWSGVGLAVLCVAGSAVIGHRFCAWLWRGAGHEDPWRPKWTATGLTVLLLMFAAGTAFTGVVHQVGWLARSPQPLIKNDFGNERSASATIKTILTAQADFRSNDRDGNGRDDYWRTDIAGLYGLRTPDGEPIRLIEPSVALADAKPLTDFQALGKWNPGPFQPKAGYYFRALKFEGETEPSPDRFAASSYPKDAASGAQMFIVSDAGVIWRKPVEGNSPPETFPLDPAKDGWTKLD